MATRCCEQQYCTKTQYNLPGSLFKASDADTDLAHIVEWGKAHGVNGCYVYCRLGDGRYEGRNFHHPDPALEDSATGVAAGALTALLGCGIVGGMAIAM